MWIAVAIIGGIAFAGGITLLPGANPKPTPSASAPASPTAAPTATTPSSQH